MLPVGTARAQRWQPGELLRLFDALATQPQENRGRADLHKVCIAVAFEGTHPFGELHGLAYLPPPVAWVCQLRALGRLAGDVRNQSDPWSFHLHASNSCFPIREHRIHQRGMECVGYRQRMSEDSFACELLRYFRYAFCLA